MALVTLEDIKNNSQIRVYLDKANEHLGKLGYTEHGYRHANLTASIAGNVMLRLGYPSREAELAAMASFLHDIGNVLGRANHGISGALLVKDILQELGMPPEELVLIIGAIANHEEEQGEPTDRVAAAAILADKSDVHRSRVRNPNPTTFDIHDRVNYAVEHSFLRVEEERKAITLELSIDTQISQIMEYFEIFLSRMVACRRAAEVLGCTFGLKFNGVKLL
ncbi:MAG: HD domain-containing protein [candidate division NC10 bacterium]|nr:HD domain-containing protein [candidate division NC10 bacterium]